MYQSIPLNKLKKINAYSDNQAEIKYIPQQLPEKHPSILKAEEL